MKKCLIGLMMLCVQTVFADSLPYYFEPAVGHYRFADKQKIDDTRMLSFTAGFMLSDEVSLEASYGHVVSYSEATAAQPSVDGGLYNMNVIKDFSTTYALTPFVLAGFGVNHFDNSDSDDASVLANANAGVGFVYPVDDYLSLRFDIKDQYTFIGGDNDFIATFGFQFGFGEPVAQASSDDF